VAPGVRTGFFVLPASAAAAFEERAVSIYIAPPFLTQATVAEFIARGRFEPNLERVCAELRARRDAMLGALARHFPGSSTWSRPEGGYFVWLDLAEGLDASALAARAAAEGVAIVRGEDFFPRDSGLGGSSARLAYSYETPERITEGVERLAALLR
jgi:DNA-binding transcriptional MocR family regulator